MIASVNHVTVVRHNQRQLLIKIVIFYCIERICKKLFTVITTGELTNSPWHLYRKCFVVSLDIDDFTFIAHAQKRQSDVSNDRKNVSATPVLPKRINVSVLIDVVSAFIDYPDHWETNFVHRYLCNENVVFVTDQARHTTPVYVTSPRVWKRRFISFISKTFQLQLFIFASQLCRSPSAKPSKCQLSSPPSRPWQRAVFS